MATQRANYDLIEGTGLPELFFPPPVRGRVYVASVLVDRFGDGYGTPV